MLGEYHGHIILDGVSHKNAVALHRNQPDDSIIRKRLQAYADAGILFYRDGGDALGVSLRAREIAGEMNIDYRSPGFAIHKTGHYGAILGISYANEKEYIHLLKEARRIRADFIKLMLTGIMDFNHYGAITGGTLKAEEIAQLIRIAHSEGFAVMAHCNTADAVHAALDANADSIEHGYFMDPACLCKLAGSRTVWVPTLAPIANLLDRPGFNTEVLQKIYDGQRANIRFAVSQGIMIAAGSDAGAFCVPPVAGLRDEHTYLRAAADNSAALDTALQRGEAAIRLRFRSPY